MSASAISVVLPQCQRDDFLATITTQRLHIQPARESDTKKCIKLYGDPEVVAMYEDGKPKSDVEVAKLVHETCIQRLRDFSPFGLYSIFKNEDGKFIGQADFFYDESHPGEIEIGYILRKKFQGQKYGTEIGMALKQYAYELIENGFSTEGHPIKSLVATAHPDNIASWKILERVGLAFTHETTKFGAPRKCYKMNL